MKLGLIIAAAALLFSTPAIAQASKTPAPEQMKLLERVQSDVNGRIKFQPETGTNDDWEIPTYSGDCEDFALLKRQKLIDAGWNPDDLKLILIWRNETSDDGTFGRYGHTVLWIKSINYILDSPVDIPSGSTQRAMYDTLHPEPYTPWAKRNGWNFKCVFADISTGDKKSAVTNRCEKPAAVAAK